MGCGARAPSTDNRFAGWTRVAGVPSTLPARLVQLLRDHKLSLSCAESCTGGLLGARITSAPGAGDVFRGGVISYADGVKSQLLGVDADVIAQNGAVHREVARAMALGVRELLGTDLGVGITGFAGPSVPPGGELGRVHIALAHWGGVESHDLHFRDDREAVREGAVDEAMRFLLDIVPRAAKARD